MEELMSLLEQLKLVDKSAIQLTQEEPDYVLDIAYQNRREDPLIAAACSNFSIRLMSRLRLTTVSTFKGHRNLVTKVQFSKSEDNLLFSASRDKSVRCWDTRMGSDKEAQMFYTAPTFNADILSLDTNHSDKLLCAGTELINTDSFILFWDRRKGSLLGCYSECHQGDVTQVSFQPGSDRYLASGSADGLVCIFDVNQRCEDDALLLTCNAMSDVGRIGWCGLDKKSHVYCITTDYNVCVWDAAEGEKYTTITDLDLSLGESAAYIVDCIPELTAVDDNHSVAVIAGDHSGNLELALFSDEETKSLVKLTGGHTATLRCSQWDSKTKTLLTGGEDSLVCLWSSEVKAHVDQDLDNKDSSIGKMKEKLTVDSRKPYQKKEKKLIE